MTATPTPIRPAACPDCATVERIGYRTPNLEGRTHCRDCHTGWDSNSQAHCTACHLQFSNVKAFDAHRTIDSCHNPATTVRTDGKPKFHQIESRHGPVWKLMFYGTRPTFNKPATTPDTPDGSDL